MQPGLVHLNYLCSQTKNKNGGGVPGLQAGQHCRWWVPESWPGWGELEALGAAASVLPRCSPWRRPSRPSSLPGAFGSNLTRFERDKRVGGTAALQI